MPAKHGHLFLFICIFLSRHLPGATSLAAPRLPVPRGGRRNPGLSNNAGDSFRGGGAHKALFPLLSPKKGPELPGWGPFAGVAAEHPSTAAPGVRGEPLHPQALRGEPEEGVMSGKVCSAFPRF